MNGKDKVVVVSIRHLFWDGVNASVLEIHFDRHTATQINCKILVWSCKTLMHPAILRKVVHCLLVHGKKI